MKKEKIMKVTIKISSLIGTVLLLAGLQSCKNDLPTTPEKHYPILFSCDDIVTRSANIATKEDLQEYGFHVWGAYLAGTPNADNHIESGNVFSFDGHVAHDRTYNRYGFTDITEYWWVADYFFAAMYPDPIKNPDNGIETTIKATANPDTEGLSLYGEIRYTDITKQVDLICAETAARSRNTNGTVGPVDQYGNQLPTSVSLRFNHMLSKINIQIKSEIALTVESVTLNNISKGGIKNTQQDWTPLGDDNINYTYICDPAIDINALTTKPVPVTGEGILVIPGSAPDFSITILTTEEEYTSELIPSTNWEQGRQYTYTATIKQKNIIFDEPEVAVWEKESVTGSVIIK